MDTVQLTALMNALAEAKAVELRERATLAECQAACVVHEAAATSATQAVSDAQAELNRFIASETLAMAAEINEEE